MAYSTNTTITVYADSEYCFEVSSGNCLECPPSVIYNEYNDDNSLSMTFGTLEEMEAVAQAMLRVVRLAKQ